jgi:CHAT domain-containing protein
MNLSPLPYSGQESRWVGRVFGDNGQGAVQLVGAQATEANVRRSVNDRRVLHFACHGLSDNDYGNLFGALAVAPGADRTNPNDDGMLTLAEIYDLELGACDLAILSACMTNYGPQQHGEGTWAISRGFLVAGARRVVASNWVVDDEAGASLVSYFCGAVAKAQGGGQAPDYPAYLHQAKRWVRGNPKWKSPFYWATFELIGPR